MYSSFFLLILMAYLASFLPLARNFEFEYFAYLAAGCFVFYPLMFLAAPVYSRVRAYYAHLLAEAGILFLGVLALRYVTHCVCEPSIPYFWFFILTVPNLFMGKALSSFYQRLHQRGAKRSQVVLMHCAAVGFLVFLGVFQVWYFPQKYLIHPIVGFWHGPIYDSWIAVPTSIYMIRLATLIFAVAIAYAVVHKNWHPWKVLPLILLSLTFDQIVTPRTQAALEKNFHLYAERGCFDFFASKQINQKLKVLHELDEDAQYYCHDIIAKLGLSDPPRLRVYVYKNSDEKKSIFGAAETDISDVSNHGVHINLGQSPHPTLKHEMVHALLSNHGLWGLGFHPNMAYTEGIAVALAPTQNPLSLHQSAWLALKANPSLQPKQVFTWKFWHLSGRSAYTIAGSFFRHLVDQKETKALIQLYDGKKPQWKRYKNMENALNQWREFIQGFKLKNASIYAKRTYHAPSPFHKKCVHSKATLRKKPISLNIRARQPLHWNPKDFSTWYAVNFTSPLEQKRRLRWQSASAQTQESLEKLRIHPYKTIEDLRFDRRFFDWLVRKDSHGKAQTIIDSLFDYLSTSYVGMNLYRSIVARYYLFHFFPENKKKPWLRYLASGKSIPVVDEPQDWMSRYLTVRSKRGRIWVENNPALVYTPLPTALKLQDNFRFEYLRILASYSDLPNQYSIKLEDLKNALKYAHGEQRLFYEDEIKKLQFGHQKPMIVE